MDIVEEIFYRVAKMRTEVATTNKQVLSKMTYSSCKQEIENATVTQYNELTESVTYIYSDMDEKIRKSVHLNNHPEGQSYAIHYFDKSGFTIYTIYYETSAMEEALVGTKYLSKGTLLYTDIQLNNEEDGSNIVKESYEGEIIPTGKRVYDITNVKELEDYCKLIYNNKEPIFNDSYHKVRFSPPSREDKTIVNARKVNIRQEASKTSDVLSIAGLGTNYHIVQIEKVIESKGEFWVQVNYGENKTGYILGDYFEAVERIIEE